MVEGSGGGVVEEAGGSGVEVMECGGVEEGLYGGECEVVPKSLLWRISELEGAVESLRE